MKLFVACLTWLTVAVICPQRAAAQKAVGNPLFLHMHDKMVQLDRYANVTGSPFLNDSFQLAAILLNDGTLAENVKVRLNVLDHELNYLDDQGREMISTQVIRSVVFKTAGNDTSSVYVTRHILKDDGGQIPEGWFQLLAKGKAALLKRYHKELKETKAYSSATVDQNIFTEIRYYVWYNRQLTRVKNTADIADAINDAKLYALVAQQRKNLKTEEDLKATVNYFNNLQ